MRASSIFFADRIHRFFSLPFFLRFELSFDLRTKLEHKFHFVAIPNWKPLWFVRLTYWFVIRLDTWQKKSASSTPFVFLSWYALPSATRIIESRTKPGQPRCQIVPEFPPSPVPVFPGSKELRIVPGKSLEHEFLNQNRTSFSVLLFARRNICFIRVRNFEKCTYVQFFFPLIKTTLLQYTPLLRFSFFFCSLFSFYIFSFLVVSSFLF